MGCSLVGLCCIQSLQNGQGSIPGQAWSFFRFFFNCLGCLKKKTFYLNVNVFSTKVLIGDTIFMSPTREGNAILCGNPSHVKVKPLVVQKEYLHFSVILRPWVLVRPQESNPWPPALQSQALPTELTLPWSFNFKDHVLFHIFICSSKYDSFYIFQFLIHFIILIQIFSIIY